MAPIAKDLAKALDLAAELQADKELPEHTVTSYAQQMADALHKHRAEIEAGPELLEALRGLLGVASSLPMKYQPKLDAAKAAIAKATGEG